MNTNFSGSNSYILPAKKLKFKKSKEVQHIGRILSKKQRKRLEKIVDVKKKKVLCKNCILFLNT